MNFQKPVKNSHEVGKKWEIRTKNFLIKQGYSIIESNYRKRCGEIDIIAQTKDIVVFIEVKYRKKKNISTPEESITKTKQKRIIQTAKHFIHENSYHDKTYRFDVITITGDDTQQHFCHYKNAFRID